MHRLTFYRARAAHEHSAALMSCIKKPCIQRARTDNASAPSYRYGDVVRQTPLQRDAHQCASYQYRTNKIMKQAYEQTHQFGAVQRHADRMAVMNNKQAYDYARSHVAPPLRK